MDAKRTFISLVILLTPLSFVAGQEKNAKSASSVQNELEAIKAELKAQQDKLDHLAEEIAKLSEVIAEKSGSATATPTATAPKAVAVSPTPPPTAGVENPTPVEQSGTRSHVVAKGETLTQIAKQYGVTVDEIAKANNIQDAKKLQIGQTIKIPPAASPSPESDKH
jgi:LysM repeat protein